MIRLTTRTSGGDITNYVAASAIARVTEAGPSSQWHGIRAFVKLFDGQTIECAETADEINLQVTQDGGAA